MKLQTFLLTYSTHASFSAIRMCYSFNKPHIQQEFGIDELGLGILDFTIYFALTLGCLFRYSIMQHGAKMTTTLLSSCTFMVLGFAVIPTVALVDQRLLTQEGGDSDSQLWFATELFQKHWVQLIIVAVSCAVMGLFQFTVWPVTISLLNVHYTVENDSSMVGLWSSSWEIGNIFSFALTNFLIFQIGLRWQVTIYTLCIIQLLFTLAIYFRLPNPNQNTTSVEARGESSTFDHRTPSKAVDSNEQNITTRRFFKFIKKSLRSHHEFALYLLISGFITSAFYALLFWLPLFLFSVGYGYISGYLTILVDFGAILGSFVFGLRHSVDPERNSDFMTLTKSAFFKFRAEVSVTISIVASVMYLICAPGIPQYIVLTFVLGFFLGGTYNTLHSKDLLEYSENDPYTTEMITTLTSFFNSLFSSVFCLIVGVALKINANHPNSNGKPKDGNSGMFYALLFMEALCLLTFGIRTRIQSRRQKITISEREESNY